MCSLRHKSNRKFADLMVNAQRVVKPMKSRVCVSYASRAIQKKNCVYFKVLAVTCASRVNVADVGLGFRIVGSEQPEFDPGSPLPDAQWKANFTRGPRSLSLGDEARLLRVSFLLLHAHFSDDNGRLETGETCASFGPTSSARASAPELTRLDIQTQRTYPSNYLWYVLS